MASEVSSWSLQRVGWTEPSFSLQPHLDVITIGRSDEVHKQCLAKNISRVHVELHKTREIDGFTYWAIVDKSSSGTYLNNHKIPKDTKIRLNDRDVIGLGTNPATDEVNQKRNFIYKIRYTAPSLPSTSRQESPVSARDGTPEQLELKVEVKAETRLEPELLPVRIKQEKETLSSVNVPFKNLSSRPSHAYASSSSSEASVSASTATRDSHTAKPEAELPVRIKQERETNVSCKDSPSRPSHIDASSSPASVSHSTATRDSNSDPIPGFADLAGAEVRLKPVIVPKDCVTARLKGSRIEWMAERSAYREESSSSNDSRSSNELFKSNRRQKMKRRPQRLDSSSSSEDDDAVARAVGQRSDPVEKSRSPKAEPKQHAMSYSVPASESAFSQAEDVIVIDSDSEYFEASQMLNLKEEPEERDEEIITISDDEDEGCEDNSRRSSLSLFDYSSEAEEESEADLRNMEKVLEHLKCLLINGKPYDCHDSWAGSEKDLEVLGRVGCSLSEAKETLAKNDLSVGRASQQLLHRRTSVDNEIEKKSADADDDGTDLTEEELKRLLDIGDDNEEEEEESSDESSDEREDEVASAAPEPTRSVSDPIFAETERKGSRFAPPQRQTSLIEPLPMTKRGRTDKSSPEISTRDFYKPAIHVGPKSAIAPMRPAPQQPHFQFLPAYSKDQITAQRREKLKSLAEQNRKPPPEKAKALPAAAVKRSVPKAQRLLDCEVPKPSTSASRPSTSTSTTFTAPKLLKRKAQPEPVVSPTFQAPSTSTSTLFTAPTLLKRKAQPEAAVVSPTFQAPVASVAVSESSSVQDANAQKVRRVAETREDADGNKRIAKLKFDNVISNVMSQDLSNLPLPVSKKLEYESVKQPQPKPKRPQAHKKIRFNDDLQVRSIPAEGRGLPVSQAKLVPAILAVQQRPPAVNGQRQPAAKAAGFQEQLKTMLHWTPSWLLEQEGQTEAPPVAGNAPLCHVTPAFANYREYCNTFYPLMLYELWTSVYQYFETRSKSETLEQIVCITEVDPRDSPFTRISVMGLISENDKRRRENVLPIEGWLCRVDLRYRAARDELRPCFGYVDSATIRNRRPDADVTYIKQLEAVPVLRGKTMSLVNVYEATIIIKKIDVSGLSLNKPIVLKGISKIQSNLRVFEAVDCAHKSPLFASLLKPERSLAFMSLGPGPEGGDALAELNPSQRRVVRSVSHMCTTRMNEPHVALVQGPPGTGKTAVIVAIVRRIVSLWHQLFPNKALPRILIAAPSNAAVDEITKRLMDARRAKEFSLMRVGIPGAVRADVKCILVDELVEKALRSNKQGNSASVQMEIDTRQRNVNKFGSDMEKLLQAPKRDNTQINLLDRKLKQETNLLRRAIEDSRVASDRDRGHQRRQQRLEYFSHADIIATTLSSSMSKQMQQVFCGDNAAPTFGKREGMRPFSICIVDEASQCVEPEALIPLRLGVTKLVLVGDPEQLPATVLSMEARLRSFAESLFKRLFRQLETVETSPVLKLTDQYRMHPEIARWPNAYFYGGMLKNGPQNRSSLLKPYLLLDLAEGCERQLRGDVSNEVEARFVSKMAVKIKERMESSGPRLSVAVITFYSSQQRLIRAKLRDAGLDPAVQVHSVDSFQGSEADIVIISCVRTNKGSIGFTKEEERFNVALTRAKFSLLVVGKFDAFVGNKMWLSFIRDAKSRNKRVPVNENTDLQILFA